jgi:hypothetical protein
MDPSWVLSRLSRFLRHLLSPSSVFISREEGGTDSHHDHKVPLPTLISTVHDFMQSSNLGLLSVRSGGSEA